MRPDVFFVVTNHEMAAALIDRWGIEALAE